MALFGNSGKIKELEQRIDREKKLRKEAERLLEEKSLAIYNANQELEKQANELLDKNKELQDMYEQIQAHEEELRQNIEELATTNEELDRVAKEITKKNALLKKSEEELEDKVEQRTKEFLEAKEAAERANRVKSEFLANMSHELRTPLNGILGYAQIMQDSYRESPEILENANIIKKCGDHLLSLINSVLDLSKLEANKMQLIESEIEIRQFLKPIFDMFKLQCSKKGIELSFDLLANVPQYIKVDSTKLRQCIINIVGNAIKFTSSGGIYLTIQASDNHLLEFKVKDTGRGIPKDKIEFILRPFEQITEAQNVEGGTGLGLAITTGFINLMGGDIEIESDEGKGTTVTFTIKVEALESIEETSNDRYDDVIGIASSKEVKVLIVDDNEVNIDVAKGILKPLDFVLDSAMNGKLAIEKYLEFKPDVILMDIRMPVMDGLEATQYIRNMGGGQDVKIIAVTAHAFENERAEFIEGGCNECIIKPYKKKDILETIEREIGIKYTFRDQPSSFSMTDESSEHSQQQAEQVEINYDEIKSLLPEEFIESIQTNIMMARLDAIIKDINTLEIENTNFNLFKSHLIELLKNMDFDALEEVSEKLVS